MKYTLTYFLLFAGWMILPLGAYAQPEEVHGDYDKQLAEHRAKYKADFLTEARSPLTASDTAFLDFFQPNVLWAIPLAKFERTPDAKPFEMMTYSGQKRDYVQYGIMKFEFEGKALTLNIYQNLRLVQDSLYRDYLFLPFKDFTNGEETYGGGRYIDLRQTDIIGTFIQVDFNKCYNPWCAFSDGFNCPIPPAANHLEIAVEAGEKKFRGEHKH